jgi:hypothetical protein
MIRGNLEILCNFAASIEASEGACLPTDMPPSLFLSGKEISN